MTADAQQRDEVERFLAEREAKRAAKRPTAQVVRYTVRGDDEQQIQSLAVRCHWCSGIHSHSWNDGYQLAAPSCGVPGVLYRITWPETPEEESCA